MARLLRDVEIGLWYQTAETGDRFEVVAMDEFHHTIEIQYFDGTLEEIEYETWSQLGASDSPPPDDDSGAMDTEPPDYDIDALLMTSWDDPLLDIDQIAINHTLL